MSQVVEINGVTLVPIKEAASRVSYTRDYVARLAREGKIVASQIGRQWFVDVLSLENFSKSAQVQDEIRNRELREERKLELLTKEKLNLLDGILLKKERSHRLDALGVVAATICLGFFIGAGLYTSTQISSPATPKFISTLGNVSASLVINNSNKALVSESLSVALPEEILLSDELLEVPVFVAESETQRLSEDALGVLVFAKGKNADSELEVGKLFSDDVETTFTSANAGVIVYENENGSLTKYPFVSVPVSGTDSEPKSAIE